MWHLQEDGHHGVSMAERRAMRDAFGDGDEGGGSDGGDWRASKFTPEEVIRLDISHIGIEHLELCIVGSAFWH